jgi:hypothetical protein
MHDDDVTRSFQARICDFSMAALLLNPQYWPLRQGTAKPDTT